MAVGPTKRRLDRCRDPRNGSHDIFGGSDGRSSSWWPVLVQNCKPVTFLESSELILTNLSLSPPFFDRHPERSPSLLFVLRFHSNTCSKSTRTVSRPVIQASSQSTVKIPLTMISKWRFTRGWVRFWALREDTGSTSTFPLLRQQSNVGWKVLCDVALLFPWPPWFALRYRCSMLDATTPEY